MKTFSARAETTTHDWYVVDAADKTLGRLASQLALRLRGKHKAIFTPHVDTGDYFVVVNVDKLAALKAGSTVNRQTLEEAGIITSPKHPLKVLGSGDIAIKLTVQAAAFTASARQKIEAAGGTCDVIS